MGKGGARAFPNSTSCFCVLVTEGAVGACVSQAEAWETRLISGGLHGLVNKFGECKNLLFLIYRAMHQFAVLSFQ